jgi:hypothetical protein
MSMHKNLRVRRTEEVKNIHKNVYTEVSNLYSI